MPGATLQLVSYGQQDLYLTGNPQITYFKVVYRRHTNFSMDDVVINTINTPGFGSQFIQRIDKLGDLVHRISLIFKGQKVYAGHGLANPTTALINYIGMVIGGHEIDRQYGHWIETWNELTKTNPNGTISNISKIDDNSISFLTSNQDLALSQYFAKSSASFMDAEPFYFDNRLNKLTNTFGTSNSYPPTKFQKTSRCGGVYCESTYLQELQTGFNETDETISSASYTDSSKGTSSASFSNASESDFSLSVSTINANWKNGQLGSTTTKTSMNSSSKIITDIRNIKKSLFTGSLLGLSVLEIPFYISKDPGLSLPLIAIQNQEIQLDINFSNADAADWTSSVYNASSEGNYLSTNGTISNEQNIFNAFCINNGTQLLKPIRNRTNNTINMNIDISVLYIYLDTDERRRFAEVSHEYLIEQVQFMTSTDGVDIDISQFSHPVKELIWTGAPYRKSDIIYAENASNSSINVELNDGRKVHKSGIRFVPGHNDNIVGGSILNSTYTLSYGYSSASSVGPGTYLKNSSGPFTSDGKYVAGLIGPSTPTSVDFCNWSISLNDIDRINPQSIETFTRYNVEKYHSGYGSVSCPDSIAIYSFALKPEEHQPSGTCNFSKIDKAFLSRYKGQSTSNRHVPLNIYAINYNILRVMSGMAGIAYTL